MAKNLLAAVLLLIVFAGNARAHDPGTTVATIIVDEDETSIEILIKGGDLGEVVGVDLLDTIGNVDPARLTMAVQRVAAHLRATMLIEADAGDCPLEVVNLSASEDSVLAMFRAPCGSRNAGLTYSSWLLHETNPGTIQIILLLKGDDASAAAVTPDQNDLVIEDPVPLGEIAVRYLRSGAVHIFIGYDHIAFLLALLLWARGFWVVVKVVTAFTISHSVTLSVAALDLFTLPSALIEPLIAATIIVVALENFINRKIERRWRVAFLLGFIHGFGFAGVLRDVGLPQDALLVALGLFNAGVEVGQIAIVGLFIPLLLTIDRVVAKDPAHPVRSPALVYSVSAVIGGLGAYWLVERLFFS